MSNNAREIKSRIKSAKNIAQITKAMEMVSAAKMRKAQSRLGQSEAYAHKLADMMHTLSGLIDASAHPLLSVNAEAKKVLVIAVTSNKGLAGALNSNTFREIGHLAKKMSAEKMEIEYVAIGKKARDFLRYTRRQIVAVFDSMGEVTNYTQIQPIAKLVIDSFLSAEYSQVYVIYPKFISTLVQKSVVHQLLPVSLPKPKTDEERTTELRAKALFEPSSEELLEKLLPYYIEQELYQFTLQLGASEHSARMIAMKNATDNAKDIRKELTLEYNSARQAQITQQIAEIASATMI
jgi:F-type H+-transporting ATPase subunit gamma